MNFFASIEAALKQAEPFALAIISGIKGSSPQKKGAKALFHADGRIDGTLGGGCLEAEVQQRARQALLTGKPESFELVLDHDFGWDDGLICGGKVSGVILPQAARSASVWQRLIQRNETLTWGITSDFAIEVLDTTRPSGTNWLYQETVAPPCALWIAGAGHIGQAVAALALRLDFLVTVFDDRPALANSRYFPIDTRFRVDFWDKILSDPLPPCPAFGLIVTRGHQHDALALRSWVKQPFVFLGMIGSHRKKRLIFEQFLDENLASPEELARVACPVGLDLLAYSVEEIALSIMAQYVRQRAQKVFARVPKSGGSSLGVATPLCSSGTPAPDDSKRAGFR